MKILIDIGHPAHVHVFKNIAWEMQKQGHQILFTCRDKEYEIELMRTYGFKFKSFGKKYKSRIGKLFGLIEFDLKEIAVGLIFKPDLLLSHGSIYAAHASFVLRKPHISLEDTFNFEQIKLYLPFTDLVLTGDYKHPKLGRKELVYCGYHELTYLHPKYFKADKNVLERIGITEGEKFVILRFVAWNASHDFGVNGITYSNKIQCINEFEKYAKVFISSEAELPSSLKKYQINIPPHQMHDVLAQCTLLFGESSTMSEECAVLGIPSIFLNQKSTYYTQHLETDYSILYNFSTSEQGFQNAVEKGKELLNTPGMLDDWHKRRQKMLNNKVDLTTFLIWLISNYPASKKTIQITPELQNQFKY